MFLFQLRQLPCCGDQTPASVPPPAKDRLSPSNTPVFLPRPFILPSFAWFYLFFSTGQEFLSTLSWCSACTSVSEGVFLMYPWREMFSTSTYSSAILLSSKRAFFDNHKSLENYKYIFISMNFFKTCEYWFSILQRLKILHQWKHSLDLFINLNRLKKILFGSL